MHAFQPMLASAEIVFRKDLTGCDEDLGLVNGSGNDQLLQLGNLGLRACERFFESISNIQTVFILFSREITLFTSPLTYPHRIQGHDYRRITCPSKRCNGQSHRPRHGSVPPQEVLGHDGPRLAGDVATRW